MQNQQGQQPNASQQQTVNAAASPVVENSAGSESRAMKALRRVQGVTAPTPPATPVESVQPAAVPTTPVQTSQPDSGELSLDIPVDEKSLPNNIQSQVINDEEIDALNDPKGENFMKLRKKLKATVKVRQELETEAENLRKKVTDYESGLAAPEQIQTMQTRIRELETFEQLHNFKSSPAYRTQITEPLNAAKSSFEDLAVNYGVEPEMVEQALSIDDEKQVNQLIARHFSDPISQLEAKEAIKKIKNIRRQASEADKNPGALAAELENRHAAQEKIVRARKNEVISNTAKGEWLNSLVNARNSQEFPELSFIEGNTEHNEKVARPLLTRSAAEYSKIVKDITESIHTGNPLPPTAMYALANMVQRAYAATLAASERERLLDQIEDLQSSSARNNAMDRPGANGINIGGAGGAPTGSDRQGGGAKGAARRVLDRVTSGR